MDDEAGIRDGAKRAIDGEWRVFYGGYWVKAYDAPADTLQAKKTLIEALTRRLFNHVEHGLNIRAGVSPRPGRPSTRRPTWPSSGSRGRCWRARSSIAPPIF